jgi:hypothetical protein
VLNSTAAKATTATAAAGAVDPVVASEGIEAMVGAEREEGALEAVVVEDLEAGEVGSEPAREVDLEGAAEATAQATGFSLTTRFTSPGCPRT